RVDRRHRDGRTKLKFNEALKFILNLLATDLIETTREQARRAGVRSVEDVRRMPQRLAGFSPAVAEQNAHLKRFLYRRLYSQPAIAEDRDLSVAALDELFLYFLKSPEKMPKFYSEQARQEPVHRVVCDYIAGMTDHFLLRQHQELLGT
ncbi:MAG: deoxyguanosinetriphosphate triphosphohydrolase, partial [Candidatus Binataceae bacterium]